MGQISRYGRLLALAIIVLAIAFAMARGWASLSQGYQLVEMDWNEDGSTSLKEFLASSDIGKRPVDRNGQRCFEYYSYKDGLPIKVACSTERGQTRLTR